MFDQLIYVAIAGAIVVAILALLKVMIDYPGMGDMCMKCIHKKTGPCPEKLAAAGIEERNDVDIKMTGEPVLCRVDPESSAGVSMSRINTDPEICRDRLSELDEILSIEETLQPRYTGARDKDHHWRRLSHEHHHKKHSHHDYQHHRRHSHDHHHRHHHHHDQQRKFSENVTSSRHHHHHRHGHHSSTESDSSPGARRKESRHNKQLFPERSHHHHDNSDTPQDSQEKVNRESPSSNSSLEKIKSGKSNNNMRININNVNILINRTHHQDVTINIDMDEGEEETAEIVEVPDEHADHEHDGEVRSSDSGIGWDEHHVHDNIVPEIQIAAAANADIQPIAEESPSQEKSDETTESATKEKFFNKLVLDSLPISMPKRFRHNTFN